MMGGACGRAEATITYTPSSIQERESGEIVFSHPKTGDWQYLVAVRPASPC